jgi:hypothetical protein
MSFVGIHCQISCLRYTFAPMPTPNDSFEVVWPLNRHQPLSIPLRAFLEPSRREIRMTPTPTQRPWDEKRSATGAADSQWRTSAELAAMVGNPRMSAPSPGPWAAHTGADGWSEGRSAANSSTGAWPLQDSYGVAFFRGGFPESCSFLLRASVLF